MSMSASTVFFRSDGSTSATPGPGTSSLDDTDLTDGAEGENDDDSDRQPYTSSAGTRIVLKSGETTHLDNGWIVQNDSFKPLFVVGAQHFASATLTLEHALGPSLHL
jgi:hypothetical protein